MAGPFLGLPLLLATLALSVDLVEVDRQPPPERLRDRPLPEHTEQHRDATRSPVPSAISATVPSILQSGSTFASPGGPNDLDLTLGIEEDAVDLPRFAPPQPPYALRDRR